MDLEITTTLIAVGVIILALLFTYTNGFQDGSSVAACAIAAHALSPLQAVYLVAIFELVGALLGGSAVADAIRSVTSLPAQGDILPVLGSALSSAIAWNFITRYLRFPSSSTHALVGGILGALYAAGGTRFIVFGQVDLVHPSGLGKVILTLFVSPCVGFLAGFLVLNVATLLLLRATMKVNKYIRGLHWFATALLAFGHGANDPQKSMGVIMLCLYAIGAETDHDIPLYVRLATGCTIALGVISLAPGIVRRVGSGIYKIRNLQGLASEVASGIVVTVGSLTGGPVAASQVVSSSVMGVGAASRARGVHWLVAKDLLMAWFMTIPCSAMLSFVLYGLVFHRLNPFVL